MYRGQTLAYSFHGSYHTYISTQEAGIHSSEVETRAGLSHRICSSDSFALSLEKCPASKWWKNTSADRIYYRERLAGGTLRNKTNNNSFPKHVLMFRYHFPSENPIRGSGHEGCENGIRSERSRPRRLPRETLVTMMESQQRTLHFEIQITAWNSL